MNAVYLALHLWVIRLKRYRKRRIRVARRAHHTSGDIWLFTLSCNGSVEPSLVICVSQVKINGCYLLPPYGKCFAHPSRPSLARPSTCITVHT